MEIWTLISIPLRDQIFVLSISVRRAINRPVGTHWNECVFSCVSRDLSRFRFVQHLKVVTRRTRHQNNPGRTRSRPNPMNPTPIIVAEFLIPRQKVTVKGMDPTAMKPMPRPMTISGPRQAAAARHVAIASPLADGLKDRWNRGEKRPQPQFSCLGQVAQAADYVDITS